MKTPQMNPERRKHMDHVSPEWVRADADYFITVCSETRKANQFCHPLIGAAILDSISYRHQRGIWFCHMAVLMPDHLHLILAFPDVPNFSKVIGEWKRWLTTNHGITWQENFFDHRLRKEESLGDKADYILNNPVRAGLVCDFQQWPYFWKPE